MNVSLFAKNGYGNNQTKGTSASNLGSKQNLSSFVKTQSKDFSSLHKLSRKLDTVSISSLADISVTSDMTEEEKKKRFYALQQRNTFQATIQAKSETGYMDLTSNTEKEDPVVSTKYNSKDVSSAISQAKNSLSAGKALIKAKRKVLELKRELVKGGDDTQEIMVALSHAKQMERVAKKKKHHLELEELVEQTQKMDEKKELSEETNSSSGFSNFDFIELSEDELEDARDEILDTISETMKEPIDSNNLEDSSADLSEISEEFSELSSDSLEQLDEAMEMLENLEVVDPHMSEEDLKKLKIKHRSSEEKDIVKADMEYLRDMLKLEAPSANLDYTV